MTGIWKTRPHDMFLAFGVNTDGSHRGMHMSWADPVCMHTAGLGRKVPPKSDPVLAEASRWLAGLTLAAVEHVPGERVFSLRFEREGDEGPSMMFVSLVPGRAGMLIEGAGTSLGKESIRGLLAQHCDITPALESISIASPLQMPELVSRYERSLPPHFRAELMVAVRSPEQLSLLQSSLAAMIRGEAAPAIHRLPSKYPDFIRPVYLAPFPYRTLGEARELQDIERAASYFYSLARAVARDLRAYSAVTQGLKAEARRLDTLEEALERDRVASDEADKLQRWGQALLMVPPDLRSGPIVSKWYGQDGEHEVLVPLIEAMDARASAARYFDRARKARRASEHLVERRRALAVRRASVGALKQRLLSVTSSEEMRDLLRRAREELGATAIRGSTRADREHAGRGRKDEERRRPYLEFLADDGAILVGRTAAENMDLTFREARPRDFWLHARDVPGSHVVLRLRPGVAEPAAGTLMRAAALAAHFSKARTDSLVEVAYTQRKFVRKIKGGVLGQVRLERFKTISVRPAKEE